MAKARRSIRPIAEVVGERMRVLREAQAMPRTQLAQRSGVALTSLNLIEAGRVEARLSSLQAVARVLGVRVTDLVDDQTKAPQPAAGTKTFFRLMENLRSRDDGYLRAAEKLLKALDRAIDSTR